MWVEFREIEFAGEQEDNGADRAEPTVAAGFALGGLEQTIEGFQKAIGLTGLRPGDDALEVVADHFGDFLHGVDLGAHDVGAPLAEQGGDDVDLFAIKDLAQLLAVEPSPRSALRGEPGAQGVDLAASGAGEAGVIAQQRPTQSLEAGRRLLLDTPGLVQGLGGVGDHMELVEGDAGLGQILGATFDEGRRHIDADRVDRLRVGPVGEQIVGQALDRPGITALGDEQHGTTFGIGGERHVVMAAGSRSLVDSQAGDAREVGLGQREIHVALTNCRHPMPALASQSCHGRERHLAREHQYQRLEQQGETRELPGPVRLHLAHRATGQLHARHADLQIALVLEEVQVPIALAHRIVHRMDAGLSGHGEPAARGKVDADGQRLRRRIQVNGHHMPGLGNTQGSLEKLLVHHGPLVI